MSIDSILKASKQKKKHKPAIKPVVDERYTGKEPIWDNWQSWTVDEFMQERFRAINFYSYYFTSKELRPAVVDWMSTHGYTKEEIITFNKSPDYCPGVTAGGLCTSMNRGMPAIHPEAQAYHDKMAGVGGTARSDEDFVREAILDAILQGSKAREEAQALAEDTSVESAISPMVRLQKKTQSTIILDLDIMLDTWMDADTDIKGILVYDKMREYDLPAASCTQVLNWLNRYRDSMQAALDKTDPDLVEGYRYLNAKQLRARIDALESMSQDLNKFKHTAKAQRAPREKKLPSAMRQVERLKYCKQDNDFKITSVNPIRVAGAYRLLAFNVKTRTLFDYVAQSANGILIKGTSLKNIDEQASRCIRLRKPDEVLPIILNGTPKQIENAWSKLTTKESKPNGRVNEEIVLLRVFERRIDN